MKRIFTRRAVPAPLPAPELAFACPKQWSDLRQDKPNKRFCDQCQHHVHDLSAMSQNEAARFLKGAQGRVCVSYRRRADGTVLNEEPPSGRWQRVWRRGKPVLALLAMVMPMWLSACASRYSDTVLGIMCDPKDRQPTKVRSEEHRTTGEPVGPSSSR